MNTTAKRCVIYGAILLAVGALLEPIFSTSAFSSFRNPGDLVAFAIALRWPLIAVGGALIGSAVVIQALKPGDDHDA